MTITSPIVNEARIADAKRRINNGDFDTFDKYVDSKIRGKSLEDAMRIMDEIGQGLDKLRSVLTK